MRGIPGGRRIGGHLETDFHLGSVSLSTGIIIGLSHRVVENSKLDNAYEVLNILPRIVNAQQILVTPIMNFFLPSTQ